jgi:hypothetical protein
MLFAIRGILRMGHTLHHIISPKHIANLSLMVRGRSFFGIGTKPNERENWISSSVEWK